MLNSAMIDLLGVSLWETLYMVVISTILSYAVGLPIGVILNITGKDGICQNRVVNSILGVYRKYLSVHTVSDTADMDDSCDTDDSRHHGRTDFRDSTSGSVGGALCRKNGRIISQ